MLKSLYARTFFFCFLSIAFVTQVFLSIRQNAPTADEYAHNIASGLSRLVKRDFRLNPAQPPLPLMLSSLPLAAMKAKLPLDHPSWTQGNSPEFARQFFDIYNPDMDRLVFWARLPIAVVGLVFGWAVFFWAKRLLGETAAWIAFVLYAFCPDLLTHSGLVTGDLCVAFFFFLAVMCFMRYLQKPSFKNTARTGLFTGLALLSKFSAVLLFPVFLGMAFFKWAALRASKAAGFLAVTLLTVWAGYFFEMKPLLVNTPNPDKKAAVYEKWGGEPLLHFAEKVPVPLATFSSALAAMVHTRAQGTNAYLMGEWSRGGWWYYYFVAFLIKNTIPFLLLIYAGVILAPRLGLSRESAAAVFVAPALFFALTLSDKAQAGIRYFLPIYPLLILLAAGAGAYLWKKNRFLKWLVVILLGWHAAEAVRVSPYTLSYFNEFIGGPKNGYRYLRDSNLDWGQGLKELGQWAQKNGNPEIALLYPWPANPSHYKIAWRPLHSGEWREPEQAVYAISAQTLEDVEWTAQKPPDQTIGHAIWIYDFRGSQR